ncbi:metalloprotease [Coprinopsis cinerea okayama7|uniref:Metalloprotease n=1 Tax=Coprinopsis cinerea (strain Okayama-7 / 130 / ATCC MYA-4618 / FGSC 9003) TaxID=240176 RepID=A8NC01_COPC7|nr:metalloprotease [Coprinopsis cinerea okayama7\|eukprot:XP_001832301.2 metalloprotease [Coprinopsis cinerea okayama7\
MSNHRRVYWLLLLLWIPVVLSATPGRYLQSRSLHIVRGRCTELDQDLIASFEKRFLEDQILHGSSLLDSLTVKPSAGSSHSRRQLQPTSKPVNVYFHVISADSSPKNGNIPVQQLIQQVDALNRGFVETGLNFVLAGVDRTVNADWFANAGPNTVQQTAMKTKLRRGGRSDLNIYTVGFTGALSGLLGYATFPQSYAADPSDDGIVILFSSVPGGAMAGYGQGKTAIHEAGHWFGLYHTFQGSCLSPGDYVEDTPPEGLPSEGCPIGRVSCPVTDLIEGMSDPIHNYMDYSPDNCMAEFSPGQALRARVQAQFYRGIY